MPADHLKNNRGSCLLASNAKDELAMLAFAVHLYLEVGVHNLTLHSLIIRNLSNVIQEKCLHM
jgi:hypothetical protein